MRPLYPEPQNNNNNMKAKNSISELKSKITIFNKKHEFEFEILGIVVFSILISLILAIVLYKADKWIENKAEDSRNNRLYSIAMNMEPDYVKFEGRINFYELVDKFEDAELCLMSSYEIENKKPTSIWRWYTMDLWVKTIDTNKEFYVFTRPISK